MNHKQDLHSRSLSIHKFSLMLKVLTVFHRPPCLMDVSSSLHLYPLTQPLLHLVSPSPIFFERLLNKQSYIFHQCYKEVIERNCKELSAHNKKDNRQCSIQCAIVLPWLEKAFHTCRDHHNLIRP